MLFESRPNSWYYTLTFDKLFIKGNYELSWFQNLDLNYLNLKSIQIKFIIIKNKSQGNKKEPFYYFGIDSITRINCMDLLHKNKRKKKYKMEVTYYKLKIKIKSYLTFLSTLVFILALLISSICKPNLQRKKKFGFG